MHVTTNQRVGGRGYSRGASGVPHSTTVANMDTWIQSETQNGPVTTESPAEAVEVDSSVSPAKHVNEHSHGHNSNDNDNDNGPDDDGDHDGDCTQPVDLDGDGDVDLHAGVVDEAEADIPTQKDEPMDDTPSKPSKEAMMNIQYKGQPVWQVNCHGVAIIMRMTDLKFNWATVDEFIQKQSHLSTLEMGELENDSKNWASVDENGDQWVSQDQLMHVAGKYKITEPIASLMGQFSLENDDTAAKSSKEGSVEKDDVSDTPMSTTGSKRKQNDPNPLESPTKKNKHSNGRNHNDDYDSAVYDEMRKFLPIKDDAGIPIFDHDLKDGKFNGLFTLKPLKEDSILSENSKVIMSSLFLPYEEDITLDKILKDEIPLLHESERKGVESQSTPLGKREPAEVFDKDQINVDVAIDDNGQAALHLAATLGKTALVEELLEKGANRFRGDNEGQNALIRVVHATNCFELLCFDKLLDLLYPSLTLLDNRGRTILHHIALSCGLKGRYDASKYYLETLLEWVVKKGSKFPSDSPLTLANFIKNVVNKSDKYGNTCLIYATLAGNKYVVSQLLDIGADPHKANKIGVTPGDYGIDVNSSIANVSHNYNQSYLSKVPGISGEAFKGDILTGDLGGRDGVMKTDSLKQSTLDINEMNDTPQKVQRWTDNGTTQRENDGDVDDANDEDATHNNGDEMKERHPLVSRTESAEFKETTNSLQILDSIQSFISNIGSEFKDELVQKSRQIEMLNPILKEKTLELSQKRKQFDELQKLVRKISKITNKIDNLNKAITLEESKFQDEVKDLNIQIDEENILGDFDADQPFTILPLYNDIESTTEILLEEKLEELQKQEPDDNDDSEKKVSGYNAISALNSISVSEILERFKKEIGEADLDALKKDIPPAVVLDARIRAYRKNNEMLMNRMKAKRDSNKELEAQFKRIIGLCIGTETDNIDDRLLSNLLMSVENDPDPEIGQIKKVLKIVGDLDSTTDATNTSVSVSVPAATTTATAASTSTPNTSSIAIGLAGPAQQ